MTDTMPQDFDLAQEILPQVVWATFFGIAGVALIVAFVIKKCGGTSQWSKWLDSEYKTRLGSLEATPIDMLDLPEAVKNYFRDNHPLIEELGFDLVGNYRMVGGTIPIYARYYWHPDDGTFVEVAICQSGVGSLFQITGVRSVTFISVFEDGTCIQTGNAQGPSEAKKTPEQLRLHYRLHLPPAELLNEHRINIDAYRKESRSQILHYPAEQLASVSEYYTQMQREHWVEQGRISPPDGFNETALRHGFAEEAESYQ